MDRYGGYRYKSYYTGVKPTPALGEWNTQSYYPHGGLAPRPDDRVRESLVPDPARGAIPSDGDSERSRELVHPLPHSNDNNGEYYQKNGGASPMVPKWYPPPASVNSYWVPAPGSGGNQLSQTTNEIYKVPRIQKGGANPTSGGTTLPMSRYSVPISTAPTEVGYPKATLSRPR